MSEKLENGNGERNQGSPADDDRTPLTEAGSDSAASETESLSSSTQEPAKTEGDGGISLTGRRRRNFNTIATVIFGVLSLLIGWLGLTNQERLDRQQGTLHEQSRELDQLGTQMEALKSEIREGNRRFLEGLDDEAIFADLPPGMEEGLRKQIEAERKRREERSKEEASEERKPPPQ